MNSRAPAGSADRDSGLPAGRSFQSTDLRRQNVSSVMRAILTHGPLPRAEVARITGLAPGSVTKLTSVLVSAGLCHELPVAEADRQPGRPPVPVGIDTDLFRVVGVHIGLLRTTIGLVDLTGRLVEEVTLDHDDVSFDAVVKQTVTTVRRFARRTATRVLGVGVSAGGWVDPESGVIIEHTALGWRDAPIRDVLARRLGLPVHVDSNFRALAVNECWFGAGTDVASLLHVFVGNVVGAGMVFHQQPHLGRRSAAGYLDHLPLGVRTKHRCECGRTDCLRAVVSDTTVVADARRLGVIGRRQDLDDLVALGHSGDRRAVRLLRARARHVGTAVALLVEILDPDRVVIGGGVVDDPAYLPDIKASVAQHLHLPLETDLDDFVSVGTFGRHAITVSSATLCLDAYYRDPMAFPPLAA